MTSNTAGAGVGFRHGGERARLSVFGDVCPQTEGR